MKKYLKAIIFILKACVTEELWDRQLLAQWLHPCAAPCKAVCAQLGSAWIAPAWLTPAALLQGVHPLALKNTEISTEWSRGVV